MFQTDIDARQMIATLSDVEKQQFPFALAKALNDTAFQDVRPGWKDEMLRVFDRPTRLTLNAVNVKKANKKQEKGPSAEIFLRDEASKGTPPARYLEHQAEGGRRPRKPFENLLQQAGVLEPGEFAVPGKSFPLNLYGNVPGRVITSVLSDVAASREASNFSTRATRLKRTRRKKKRGGVYFYSRGDRRQLPRGIYERIGTAFGSAVRTVFIFTKQPVYRARFDAVKITQDLFNKNFPKRFRAALKKAVATAKPKPKGRR